MAILFDEREAYYRILFADVISEKAYKITYLNEMTGKIDSIERNYRGSTSLHDSEFKEFIIRLAQKKRGR